MSSFFKPFTMRKNYYIFSAFCFAFLISEFSKAQCPDGLIASYFFSGPASCTCVNAAPIGGVAPYSYDWGNGVSGAYPSQCFLPPGNYIFVVTDAQGCTDDTTFTILAQSNFSFNISTTPANCRNGTATASVTGGTPPYSFLWSTIPPQTDSIATGLHPGTYTFTVADDSGCASSGSVLIPSNSNLNSGISFIADTCGHGVGSLTGYAVSGVPPYHYLWNTGDTITSLNNLTASYFSFTVTDDSGCVSMSSQSLPNYSPVQVAHSEIQPSCTNNAGSITLNTTGGTPSYNYFWNTVPPQSTSTAVNLAVGYYTCLITDLAGCTANVAVMLNDNSSLSVSSVTQPDTCNHGVGVATAFATNGFPPYTYQWNQFAASSNPVLNGLYESQNVCWITDDSGCTRKAIAYVGFYSPVHVNAAAQNASCIFTADGSATAFPTGGTFPYSYSWTNGGTGSSVSNFLPGHYSVLVIDAQGCAACVQVNIGYDSIAPCAVTVHGTIFNDTSLNCLQDPGEVGLTNVRVSCMPVGGYKWTDYNGQYNFYLPPGIYTTSQSIPPWHTQFCPSADYIDTLPVPGMVVTDDFADVGNAVDLDIGCYGINVPIPGFSYHQSVFYRNQGTKTIPNAVVTVQHDPRIVFLNSQPPASNYNATTSTITIPVGTLAPFGTYLSYQGDAVVNYMIPSSLTIGSILEFRDTIFPIAGDTVPLNNSEVCYATVVGSFDPNSIEVTPKGTGYNGFISRDDSLLTYVVRFQNTGNWYATNIVVEVQLDSDLDLASFQLLGESFPCSAEISPSGLAKFTFLSINLPDSNMNEALSHGYVAFSLKQQPGLPENTQIIASANIYFDYNYPVLTNDALNTILGVADPALSPAQISLSPNPSSGMISINIHLNASSRIRLEILDALGKVLMKGEEEKMKSGINSRKINVSAFSPGMYFIKVTTETGTASAKFIRN